MKRHLFDLVTIVLLGSLVAGVLAVAVPSIRGIVLHVYVLGLGALVLAALLAAVGELVPRARPGAFDQALAGAPPALERLADLERLEREVTLAVATEWDLRRRLLPLLREIATMRLERSGRQLNEETAGRWWDLLRPDRPAPEDRFRRGIGAGELAALVDDLDALGDPPAAGAGRM